VASGIIRKGDEVMALPSRKKSKVKQIIGANGEQEYAFPPQAITVSLEDEIDVSRGEMLAHPDNLPRVERHFEAMLVWMDEHKMNPETHFYIKHGTHTTKARLDAIRYRIDVNTLEKSDTDAFELNEIGRVVLTTMKPLLFDPYKKNSATGSFVLIDPVTHNTSAVGMIIDKMSDRDLPSRITDMDREKISRGEALIPLEKREKRFNQKGHTIWITGLHGSGKNELAYTLEKQLFEMGANVVLMDGSTVRSGLSRELDYTAADRAEHLRRVAHVARILNDQGLLCICSFISPNEDIRSQVREIIGPKRVTTVFMDAELDFCRRNKPDLYEKADRHELEHMPGVDEKFEAPLNAEVVCKPEENSRNPEKIVEYLQQHKIFPMK
jgi:adenylyl-sulfate kinase